MRSSSAIQRGYSNVYQRVCLAEVRTQAFFPCDAVTFMRLRQADYRIQSRIISPYSCSCFLQSAEQAVLIGLMSQRRLAGAENNTGWVAQRRQQQGGIGKVGNHARLKRPIVQRLAALVNLLLPNVVRFAQYRGQVNQCRHRDALTKQRGQSLPDSGVL